MPAAPDLTAPLPKTAAALRALLLAARAERDSVMAKRDRLVAERDALAGQNDRLRHLLLRLKRMQFGAKSERLPEEQLQLGLEDLEQAIALGEAEGEKRDLISMASARPSAGQAGAHCPRTCRGSR